MNHYLLDLSAFFTFCAIFWLWSRVKYRRRSGGLPLPPGPKGLPVIGNILDMPMSGEEWLTVSDWGKKYGVSSHSTPSETLKRYTITGDVIYVENLGQPLIFINTYKAAFELLDKKSNIYSDRPRAPMLAEL